MHCRITAYGNSERSTHRACDISTAQPMPITMAIASPMSATAGGEAERRPAGRR